MPGSRSSTSQSRRYNGAFEVTSYREQSLSSGTQAAALAYIQIKTAAGKSFWGAGVDTNIELASIKAVLSAVNRAA